MGFAPPEAYAPGHGLGWSYAGNQGMTLSKLSISVVPQTFSEDIQNMSNILLGLF